MALTGLTLRGGYPGRDGASMAYRLASDSSNEDWRGWNEPNIMTNLTAPDGLWDQASTIDSSTMAVIPDTGEIVVVVGFGGQAKCYRYDPRTQTWTAGKDFTSPALAFTASHLEMVWDPTREVLILYHGSGTAGDSGIWALYSADKGDNWSIFSRGQFEVDTHTGG